MAEQAEIGVQVWFAPPPPAAPLMLPLRLPAGSTLADALACSGLAQTLEAGVLEACRIGIWGKLRPADTVLRDADRIELYRPLQADPKESRRRRAKQGG